MRLAIVGSGVAGLTCAHVLGPHHDVTLFEAAGRLGGHTNTVDVEDPTAGPLRVDTGFIVHNDRNYPNLLRLFAELGVATQDSEMSFSVTDTRSGLSYRATNPATLLARPANAVDRRFWRMLVDIARFYRDGRRVLADHDRDPDGAIATMSIADFLAAGRYSRAFIDLHLIPMGAAVWSTAPDRFRAFPAIALLRFLRNHGLLGVGGRPQWRTVVGGARTYVDAIAERFEGTIRIATPVTSVARVGGGERTSVAVTTAESVERFDAVILACHSDQARKLVADRTGAEDRILGAIGYTDNEAVLHTDTSVMPPARRAWAAWNYHAGLGDGAPTLTYDMTTLQRLPGTKRYLVTLNPDPDRPLAGELGRYRYAHPLYTDAAIAAQREVDAIDGVDGIYYCGAYWGYGFHEDGVVSARRVCRKLGVTW